VVTSDCNTQCTFEYPKSWESLIILHMCNNIV